jgi:hypothetical protein
VYLDNISIAKIRFISCRHKKARTFQYRLLGIMVPGDRIELPTRGFSILCSTD